MVTRVPGHSGTRGQLWGAALLSGAVVAAMVLGRLQNPIRVTGSASAAPPPPPPAVGSCLLQAPPELDFAPGRPLPALPLGSCADPHFGEIFAVVQPTAPSFETGPCWRQNGSGPDPLSYLGYPAVPADSWFPLLNFSVVASGPDPLQTAAGQEWVACSIAVWPYFDDRPFTAILENSHVTGTMPVQFAGCLDSPDPNTANAVRCDQPHAAQYFAQMQLAGPGPTSTDLADSCQHYVAQETRIPDLDDVDELQTTATPYLIEDTSLSVQTVADLPLQPGQRAYATCAVSTRDDRLLVDDLIALGDRPLPLAP